MRLPPLFLHFIAAVHREILSYAFDRFAHESFNGIIAQSLSLHVGQISDVFGAEAYSARSRAVGFITVPIRTSVVPPREAFFGVAI